MGRRNKLFAIQFEVLAGFLGRESQRDTQGYLRYLLTSGLARDIDIKDAGELIKYWQEAQNGNPSWEVVIETAIAALPQAEQARTRERLAQYHTPSLIDFGMRKNRVVWEANIRM